MLLNDNIFPQAIEGAQFLATIAVESNFREFVICAVDVSV
jgi:hypothetical protein